MPIPEHLQELLRRLTVGDETTIDRLMRGQFITDLDHRTAVLVEIAALVALEAEGASFQAVVDNARAAGVEDEEILETVMTVSPLVGAARLSSVLPRLAGALGAEIPAGQNS